MAEAPQTSKGPQVASHRPDIDALRAVAIVLVILYHADVKALAGGFVGVDVFFAISGYLITRNLLLERDRHGRIALRSFWARRLRRLVPAMSVMVAATMVIGVMVMIPLTWSELAAQGLTASLYVANIHFARVTGDYFAAGVDTAPLLHTWSLAVEEQFYIVWPVLVSAVLWLAAKAKRQASSTATIVTILSVVTAASFIWAVRLVDQGSINAFYGLPSRTWEFALAGLLAVATTRLEIHLSPRTQVAMASAGLVAIGWSAFTFDASTKFPGIAALPAVVGTCALILAGSNNTPDVLSGQTQPVIWRTATAPIRWLGKISYSWYLWHWPAMVLAVTYTGEDSVRVRLLAGAVSLAISQMSLMWIEDPVRTSPRLAQSRLATLAVATAFTLLAVGSTFGVQRHLDNTLQKPFYRDIAAASNKRYLDNCTWIPLDEAAPNSASTNRPRVKTSDANFNDVCSLGNQDSAETILVMGDSHAMQWTPGFDLAGKELDVRVLVRARGSCPAVPVPTTSRIAGRLDTKCERFRQDTLALAHEVKPELVVAISSDLTRRASRPDGIRIADREGQLDAWAEALGGLRDELEADGIAFGALLDNPRVIPDPLTCMQESRDIEGCTPSRKDATRAVRLHVANELEVLGDAVTLDTIDMSCTKDTCNIWQKDTYVYADSSHYSANFTEAHAGDLVKFIKRFAPFGGSELAAGSQTGQTQGS